MALFGHVRLLPHHHTSLLISPSFTKHNKSNFPQQFKLESYTSTTISKRLIPIISIHALAAKTTEHSDSKVQSLPPTSVNGWAAFAKNVSGEWDGFGAEFTNQGKPIELPENVVPEAYREWEVKVFDWQTQCPTLAQGDDAFSFMYKSIRLLPTVGCEADAATRHSIDERSIVDDNISAFAYQSSGCYVAAWSNENKANPYMSWELEHCLIDPREKESRVRIIQVVRLEDSKLVLQNVKVFCEHWYGPFRNGDQLGGCAIQDSAFASTQALDPAQVIGVWEGKHAISSFHNSPQKVQELVDGSTRKTVRELDLVLLPRQLWCCLKDVAGGETCCEVGWLFEKGRAMTSKCIFSDDGKLKEIAIACESAASAE
ncbi:PREDICTED: uncharacterized protein LOC109213019 isoform X1 [Nicotiana attenuata]|uniref:Uncharacterized protein n=1 Tax=Nicotiana attenuata TaxID=49451 RepID=A0A1J6KHJ6_NICAT|nr:PREDICTED: uncharacterized protein LOC109213019 isoform X1 [Nicotiana attenuata]OIT28140.1 hypothetical protein A4A49_27252 [Nicotiana attenuata]